jgi:hypothetical protein
MTHPGKGFETIFVLHDVDIYPVQAVDLQGKTGKFMPP